MKNLISWLNNKQPPINSVLTIGLSAAIVILLVMAVVFLLGR
jgi:hypothetical protein